MIKNMFLHPILHLKKRCVVETREKPLKVILKWFFLLSKMPVSSENGLWLLFASFCLRPFKTTRVINQNWASSSVHVWLWSFPKHCWIRIICQHFRLNTKIFWMSRLRQNREKLWWSQGWTNICDPFWWRNKYWNCARGWERKQRFTARELSAVLFQRLNACEQDFPSQGTDDGWGNLGEMFNSSVSLRLIDSRTIRSSLLNSFTF